MSNPRIVDRADSDSKSKELSVAIARHRKDVWDINHKYDKGATLVSPKSKEERAADFLDCKSIMIKIRDSDWTVRENVPPVMEECCDITDDDQFNEEILLEDVCEDCCYVDPFDEESDYIKSLPEYNDSRPSIDAGEYWNEYGNHDQYLYSLSGLNLCNQEDRTVFEREIRKIDSICNSLNRLPHRSKKMIVHTMMYVLITSPASNLDGLFYKIVSRHFDDFCRFCTATLLFSGIGVERDLDAALKIFDSLNRKECVTAIENLKSPNYLSNTDLMSRLSDIIIYIQEMTNPVDNCRIGRLNQSLEFMTGDDCLSDTMVNAMLKILDKYDSSEYSWFISTLSNKEALSNISKLRIELNNMKRGVSDGLKITSRDALDTDMFSIIDAYNSKESNEDYTSELIGMLAKSNGDYNDILLELISESRLSDCDITDVIGYKNRIRSISRLSLNYQNSNIVRIIE